MAIELPLTNSRHAREDNSRCCLLLWPKPEHALCSGHNSLNGPFFIGDNVQFVTRAHITNLSDNAPCLRLCESNNPATSYAQPNAVYPDTTGLGNALFTGAQTFTTEDYEVWAAT